MENETTNVDMLLAENRYHQEILAEAEQKALQHLRWLREMQEAAKDEGKRLIKIKKGGVANEIIIK